MGHTDENSASELQLEHFLTYRMARVQAKLNAQATRILREHADITLTQWRLIILLEAQGQTTAAHLSRVAAMDKGLISRNIKFLVDLGLVDTQRDEIDSRSHHLKLTEAGHKMQSNLMPRMRARQMELRSRLSDEENRLFISVLKILEDAADDPSV